MRTMIALMLFLSPQVFADEPVRLNFAVVALVADAKIRTAFEDELVRQLHDARFDGAQVSHPYLPLAAPTVARKAVLTGLKQKRLDGALVIRPIAMGPDAKPDALAAIPEPTARTITEFLAASGAQSDWSVAVQVGAFLLGPAEPQLFWRGVSWIERTDDRAAAIRKLATAITSNAVSARAEFRQAQKIRRAGGPPADG